MSFFFLTSSSDSFFLIMSADAPVEDISMTMMYQFSLGVTLELPRVIQAVRGHISDHFEGVYWSHDDTVCSFVWKSPCVTFFVASTGMCTCLSTKTSQVRSVAAVFRQELIENGIQAEVQSATLQQIRMDPAFILKMMTGVAAGESALDTLFDSKCNVEDKSNGES
jgi:hypothetical protein